MDPVQSANRWYQWHVRGSTEVLDQVLSSLEANLPPGWRRLTGAELEPYPSNEKPGSHWYILESSPAFLGAVVSVYLWKGMELRGGRALFTLTSGTQNETGWKPSWAPMMQFLDEGVVAAAGRVGAVVYAPTFDEMFLADLPSDVSYHLKHFSASSKKRLPLDRDDSEKWNLFVIRAFRGRAVVDSRHFIDWLVHAGWRSDDAAKLCQQFYDQCVLLERYVEEVSAA